jgi:zinc protease
MERPGEFGYLSLLSTLLTRGCGKLGRAAFAEDCDRRGANVNVYPGRDHVTLEFWVLPEDFFWAVQTMYQMVWSPRLEAEEVGVAADEHLSQFLARADEKRARLFDASRQSLFFPDHPYSRPLLGDAESLEAATAERLSHFHGSLLESLSAILCVTGGFDQESLLTEVRRRFSDICFGSVPAAANLSAEFRHQPGEVLHIPFPVEQAEVLVALPAIPRWHEDYRLTQFCNEILGGAFLSRLTRAVRVRDGLAYSADSRFRAGLEAGVVWIGLQTDKANLEAALQTTRQCIDELVFEGVGEEEFHHFKEFVGCSMPFDYDALASVTSRRLEGLLFGEPWQLKERRKLFEQTTTPEAVQDIFQRILRPDRALVCILGEGIDRRAHKAFYEPPRTAARLAVPLRFIPGPAAHQNITESQAERLRSHPSGELFRFPNGLHLLSLPRPDVASISLQLWTLTGSMDERPGRTGLSHLLEHLMFRGTENFPDGSFDAILAQRGGLNNAFTTEDFTVYTDYLAPEGLPEALALEADRFRNLQISEELFQTERSVVLEERSVRVDCSPLGKAYEKLQSLAFSEHPYGHPIIGWREDLESIGLLDIQEHYRLACEPDRLLVVVAGGCSTAQALDLVEANFAWAPRAPKPAAKWPVMASDTVVPKLTRKGVEFQERSGYSYLLLGYRFPREGHPDFAACELLSRIVGEGDSCRLYERFVRQERRFLEAWTSYESQTRDHPLLHVGFAATENFETTVCVRSIGDYLAELGPQLTAEELEKARRSWLAEEAFETDELEDWALEIAGRVMLMPWADVWTYRQRIEGVTLDDLRQAASRYLRSDGVVHVALQGESEL